MKTAVIVIVALLVGLVLGNWSVKEDLRRTEREVASLRKELSRRSGSLQGRLSGVTSMLKIQDDEAGRGRSVGVAGVPPSRTNVGVVGVSPSRSNVGVAGAPPSSTVKLSGEPGALRRNSELRKQWEAASGVWKARADLARSGFLATVAETDALAAQFDVTLAAMNLRMSNSVRTWVESVGQRKEFSSEDGIRIMKEISTTLVQAYDDLDRAMPADWRAKAGPEFELVNFINPEVVMPLADIEDRRGNPNDTLNIQDADDVGAP